MKQWYNLLYTSQLYIVTTSVLHAHGYLELNTRVQSCVTAWQCHKRLRQAKVALEGGFIQTPELVSFPDRFSPHRINCSGEQAIPFSFPAIAKIVT